MAKVKRASASGILNLINRIEAIAQKVEDLCHEIFGNGKPGLKSDLTDVKLEIVEIRTQLKMGVALLGLICSGIFIPLILKYVFHIGG